MAQEGWVTLKYSAHIIKDISQEESKEKHEQRTKETACIRCCLMDQLQITKTWAETLNNGKGKAKCQNELILSQGAVQLSSEKVFRSLHSADGDRKQNLQNLILCSFFPPSKVIFKQERTKQTSQGEELKKKKEWKEW